MRIFNGLLLTVTVLLATFAGAPMTHAQSAPPELVEGLGYVGVIMPGADLYRDQTGLEVPSVAITATEIAALEAALGEFLRASGNASAVIIADELPAYHRQYGGVEVDGKAQIYANFFCRDIGIDWHVQPVSVDDGGRCFFQVLFDPVTGTFSHLIINGDG
jgi:hypothetical protein